MFVENLSRVKHVRSNFIPSLLVIDSDFNSENIVRVRSTPRVQIMGVLLRINVHRRMCLGEWRIARTDKCLILDVHII